MQLYCGTAELQLFESGHEKAKRAQARTPSRQARNPVEDIAQEQARLAVAEHSVEMQGQVGRSIQEPSSEQEQASKPLRRVQAHVRIVNAQI